jgi:lysophospholipase L1-like esterase
MKESLVHRAALHILDATVPELPRRCIIRGAMTLFLPAILGAVLAGSQLVTQTAVAENRFEKAVRAYEASDRTAPPPQGAILLAGDSQFYRWKTLHEDLPGYTIINRGIDSFTTEDLVSFTNRLVLPYKPRLIVLHVGGNDVTTGRTPQQVLSAFQAFVHQVRAALPSVPIAFSSLTPGPGRWSQAAQRRQTNLLIKNYVATEPGLMFVDLWEAMLTPEGGPREELWVEDRIHPNHDGYLLRVKIMKPILGSPDQKP